MSIISTIGGEQGIYLIIWHMIFWQPVSHGSEMRVWLDEATYFLPCMRDNYGHILYDSS